MDKEQVGGGGGMEFPRSPSSKMPRPPCFGARGNLSETVSVVEVPDGQRSVVQSGDEASIGDVELHRSHFRFGELVRLIRAELHHFVAADRVPDAHQRTCVRRHHLRSKKANAQNT